MCVDGAYRSRLESVFDSRLSLRESSVHKPGKAASARPALAEQKTVTKPGLSTASDGADAEAKSPLMKWHVKARSLT